MKKENNNSLSRTIHQINNLLASANLSTEILLKEIYGPLNPRQKKQLNAILSEGKKIAQLIKKLKS